MLSFNKPFPMGNHLRAFAAFTFTLAMAVLQPYSANAAAADFQVAQSQSVDQPTTVPSPRYDALSWANENGDVWIFRGKPAIDAPRLTEFWHYDSKSREWALLRTDHEAPVYGTMGVGSPENTPGLGVQFGSTEIYSSSHAWVNSNGDLMFYEGANLWKYDVSEAYWIWLAEYSYSLSVRDEPHPMDSPGYRTEALLWNDDQDNLWLSNGYGYEVDGTVVTNRPRQDVWKLHADTLLWERVSGHSVYTTVSYGTQGVASEDNWPHNLDGAATWVDKSDNLWMFGGNIANIGSTSSLTNALWKFDTTTELWTWIRGSSEVRQPGVYGKPGVANEANTPGARMNAIHWTDKKGDFWLYGGEGITSGSEAFDGTYSDLWKFDVDKNSWIWVDGPANAEAQMQFAQYQKPDTINRPGSRHSASAWTSKKGELWMFGGAYGSAVYNDLWSYNIKSGKWTYEGGPAIPFESNLTGILIGLKSKCKAVWKSPGCRHKVSFMVSNLGQTTAEKSRTAVYLSDDQTLDVGDMFLTEKTLKKLKFNKKKAMKITVKVVPESSGKYLIVKLDSDESISEANENDNVLVSEPLP